jgi:hypothetical protein
MERDANCKMKMLIIIKVKWKKKILKVLIHTINHLIKCNPKAPLNKETLSIRQTHFQMDKTHLRKEPILNFS